MKKILRVLGLILLAGAIGFSLYWVFKSSPTVPHQFEPIATTTPSVISFEKKTITEENKENKYAISIEYPMLKGSGNVVNAINKSIDLQVKNEMGWFKKNAVENLRDLPPVLTETAERSFLEMKYDFSQTLVDQGILSIHFTELFYLIGAAHPGHGSVTMTYDMKTGKQIEMKDIFIGDYLNFISKLTIEKLKVQLVDLSDAATIENGAGAKAENYDDYYFAEDGMHILFEDYQVAPYAAGPQEVVLTYNEVQTIINPQGILSVFKK